MTAIEEIAVERRRQIEKEGWSFDHDNEHTDGSLAAAAACYAYNASLGGKRLDLDNREGFISLLRFLWPRSWDRGYWKPKSPRRDLVRAGALIVAEIQRLDRLG